MVNTIARLRANNLLKADALGEYELAPPKKQIIVSLSDGSEKIIDIGKKNEENPTVAISWRYGIHIHLTYS